MKKKVNRGMKIRIFPNDVQMKSIEQTFGCVRHIWNYSLMERLSVLELFGEYPELYNSHKCKSQKDWKEIFDFYRLADSQALNTEQQILNQTMKRWFKKKCRKPRYKSKKNLRNSYTTHNSMKVIRIEDNYIWLPKVGLVKMSKNRKRLPEGVIIKAVTVSKNASGKYFVSLRLEFEQEIKVRNNEVVQSIGLDFSMTHFYVDNQGKKANFPSYIIETMNKIKKLDRVLSKQKNGSNRKEKNRIKRAKLYEKLSNQKKDYHHKISRQLVTKNDVISVETLSLREMDEYKSDRRKIQMFGFHQFLTFLEYKCEEEGVLFHKVGKWYPSTQECSVCHKKKKMPRSVRTYICDHCGNVLNRDVNAAINLTTKGFHKLILKQIEDRIASLARYTYDFALSEII